jgi:hypothetical protein
VTSQPSAALIRASGKCAECHINQQYSIVHEYSLSVHTTLASGITGVGGAVSAASADHRVRRTVKPFKLDELAVTEL